MQDSKLIVAISDYLQALINNLTMNRIILSAVLICSLSLSSQAQVVINEVIFGGTTSVEIKNLGTGTVDLSTYQLCSFPTYNQLQNLTIISGALARVL